MAPGEVDFGEVYVGTSASSSLRVTNGGRTPQALHLETSLPFELPGELALPGGASAEVIVTFLPAAPGPFEGSLLIGTQTVTLRGHGLEVPECREPANTCSAAHFDPIEAQCVITQRPDGSACISRCVSSGMCSLGICVGDFASCDDGNPCTDDSCSEAQGCLHTPKTCPSSRTNPCRVGACDPMQGCGFADAADGVLCGPRDCRRKTVPVCIAAQCVDRPLPAPECLSQFAYLKASNTGAADSFGNRIAISADGQTIAVGASVESSASTGINGNGADNSALQSGAVYVFHRVASAWQQEAYLKASNTGAGDAFGHSLALSADGSTLIVGAHLEDSAAGAGEADNSALDSGAVYIFARRGGAWLQDAYLKASNAGQGDGFGASLAVSADGSRLVVGASGEDSAGPPTDNSAAEAGAVYLFRRTADSWSQQAYLKASHVERGDLFGFSVTLSADGATLAVGAPGEDSEAAGVNGNQTSDAAPQSGAVFVFHLAAEGATEAAFVKASNTGAADVFGFSLALSADGTVLAVGAYGEDSRATGIDGDQADNAASQSGAAYLFRSRNGVWAQEAYLKASFTQSGDDFGYSVALAADGRALAVGAWSENGGSTGIDGPQFLAAPAPDSGAVYLFRQEGGTWAQDAYLKQSNTDPGDFFGHSVALSADAATLVSSAVGEDSSGPGNQLDNSAQASGAVYVFSLQ